MGISLLAVAVFAMEDYNDVLVYMMMVYLAFYQWSLGTYTWVYLGAVACDEGLSMATFFTWCPIFPASMFDKLGSAGTFYFFSAGTLLCYVFFHFTLKETKGLTRDEAQVLYARGRTASLQLTDSKGGDGDEGFEKTGIRSYTEAADGVPKTVPRSTTEVSADEKRRQYSAIGASTISS